MNTSIAALKRSKSNLDTLIGELNKVAEPQSQNNHIKMIDSGNQNLINQVMVMQFFDFCQQ